MNFTRRGMLLASASVPIAAAMQQAPLTKEELRVLAMASTPPEAWEGREQEYIETRTISPESETLRVLERLESMGLVRFTQKEWGTICRYATPTEAGLVELRKAGVEA